MDRPSTRFRRGSPLRPFAPVVLLAALLALGGASAQTARFGVGAGHLGAGAEGDVALSVRNAAAGEARAGVRIGLRVGPAAPRPRLGLELRRTRSFGPVGNLLLEAAGDVDAAGRYAASAGARGVAGQVAVALEAAAWNAPESAFGDLPGTGDRPRVEGRALGLAAGVTYRVDRSLVLAARPEFLLAGGRVGARLEADVRLARLHGRDDGLALVHAYLPLGGSEGAVALGAGYAVNRRRAPTWSGSLWLGVGPSGVGPGVRLQGGERLPGGALLELEAGLEPYRLDLPPYRAALRYRRPLGDGALVAEGGAALDPAGGAGPEFALRMAWEWKPAGR